jgi:hypothetical protein
VPQKIFSHKKAQNAQKEIKIGVVRFMPDLRSVSFMLFVPFCG